MVVVAGQILRELVPRRTRPASSCGARRPLLRARRGSGTPSSVRARARDARISGIVSGPVAAARTSTMRWRVGVRRCACAWSRPRDGLVQHRRYEAAPPSMRSVTGSFADDGRHGMGSPAGTRGARKRFEATVAKPAAEVRLDVAAFCLAAHAHPGLDVDAWCGRLDELATGCPHADIRRCAGLSLRGRGIHRATAATTPIPRTPFSTRCSRVVRGSPSRFRC